MTLPRWSAEHWSLSLWATLGALYMALTALYISRAGLFDDLAADYRVFRASAEIAVHEGMAPVYDREKC